MPSGAGHDAQVLAERMKSAMLFVPSIGGISHHYAENTEDADIVLVCQVFADAAAEILAGSTVTLSSHAWLNASRKMSCACAGRWFATAGGSSSFD